MNKTSFDIAPSLSSSYFQSLRSDQTSPQFLVTKIIPDPSYRYYSEADFKLLISRTYPNSISGYLTENKEPPEPVTAKSISNKFWDKEDILRDRHYGIKDQLRDQRSLARKARNKTLDFEDDLKKAKRDAEKEVLRQEKENKEKAVREELIKQHLEEVRKRSFSKLAYNYSELDGKTDDISSNLNLIKECKEKITKLKQPTETLNLRFFDQCWTSQSYFRPFTSSLETSRQNSNFHRSIEYLSNKLEAIRGSQNIS